MNHIEFVNSTFSTTTTEVQNVSLSQCYLLTAWKVVMLFAADVYCCCWIVVRSCIFLRCFKWFKCLYMQLHLMATAVFYRNLKCWPLQSTWSILERKSPCSSCRRSSTQKASSIVQINNNDELSYAAAWQGFRAGCLAVCVSLFLELYIYTVNLWSVMLN